MLRLARRKRSSSSSLVIPVSIQRMIWPPPSSLPRRDTSLNLNVTHPPWPQSQGSHTGWCYITSLKLSGDSSITRLVSSCGWSHFISVIPDDEIRSQEKSKHLFYWCDQTWWICFFYHVSSLSHTQKLHIYNRVKWFWLMLNFLGLWEFFFLVKNVFALRRKSCLLLKEKPKLKVHSAYWWTERSTARIPTHCSSA